MNIFARKKNVLLSFFTVCSMVMLIVFAVFGMSFETYAAATSAETLNLTLTKQNVKGDGYFWNNITKTLTLYGISIVTESEYGLKVPHGATIELQGKNYISAARFAVGAQGDVTVKGTGSLTLISDEVGVNCYAETSSYANFVSGTIDITAGDTGIRSSNGSVTVIGSNIKVKTNGNDDSAAVYAHLLQINGGILKANASLCSETELRYINADGEISSSRSALIAEKKISVSQVEMRGGDDSDSLVSIEEYSGERCIVTHANADRDKGSIILGKEYSQWMDVLLIVAAVALLIAIVVIPLAVRYRRTEKLKKRLAEEENSKKNKV